MKSIFITGVTSGIGKVVLDICLREGFQIVALIRNEEQKKLFDETSQLQLLVCDLEDREKIQNVLALLSKKKLDYILLNAGLLNYGEFDSLPESSFEKILEVNLLVNMRIVHHLLPEINKNKTKLVFVSSIVARMPCRKFLSYAVSKAGLSQFCSSLMVEYPHLQILCLEIGAVNTKIHSKAGMELDSSKFVRADIIGKRLYKAMLSKTGIVTLRWQWYLLRKCLMVFEDVLLYFMINFLKFRDKK